MEHYFALTGLAVGLFVATNLDDIFVLISFYANPKFKARQIVAGQYLGIAALFGVSVVASLITLVIAPAYVGLLGLIPIAIGLRQLNELWRGGDDDGEDISTETGGYGNIVAVSAVTIANGGDNISIYVPVFGAKPMVDIVYFGMVFIVMTGLWLALAHWLVNHRTFGEPIRRYGARLVPFAFITLGVFILHEAGTLELLRK